MEQIRQIQNEFGQYLRNYIKSKVRDEEDANDIYQDVLVKLLTRSENIRKTGSIKSWVFTIARNQIIDYYRARRPTVDPESVQATFRDDTEQAPNNAYQQMESCIHRFIGQLPGEYQFLIRQSELEGKSQKELAENLGMNYVTLRSKVQRGRERLKKMLLDSCRIEQAAVGSVTDCSPRAQTDDCCGSPGTAC